MSNQLKKLSALLTDSKFQVMKPLTISRVVKESYKTFTLFFNEGIKSKPGQFIMLWLPDVDEKPFSMSGKNSVTVEIKGKYTKALAKLKKGDKLFYRGPFGKPYTLSKAKGKNTCIIAGGLGIASISTLAEALPNADIIYGARSKKDLIFSGRFKKQLNICTDDGSFGFHGFVTQKLNELLKKKKYSVVYTCGPEVMMKKILEICNKNKIYCECSLERFMYCGLGLCSSCTCNGRLVCKDGPVFNNKELAKMKDFGKYALLKSGKKVEFSKYMNFRS